MPLRLIAKPILESFIDNVLRDKVQPKIGSVVYCDLAFSTVEHSGIYIGDGKIAHLDGSGFIEVVDDIKFLSRLNGFNTAISIYVSCKGTSSKGSKDIAKRAISRIGIQRDYKLLEDNCHQFTAGCLTNSFENNYNLFYQLKKLTYDTLDCDTFRVWDRDSFDLKRTIQKIEIQEKNVKNSIKETINPEVNIELVKMTSLLIHYVIDKDFILPTDILYFENLLKKQFRCQDKTILKEMYELRKKIKKKDIEILVLSCFNYFSMDDIDKIKSILEKIIEEEKGVYIKYRDIKLTMHKVIKENKW